MYYKEREFVKDYTYQVLPLEPNRIRRLYVGGMGLDKWQNLPITTLETTMSEDMCVNTGPYIGPGDPYDQGYSQTILEGEKTRLASLIESDEEGYLGKEYVNRTHGHSGVCCRVGDSVNRLIIQYHPTNEFAKKHFNYPFGKTEAWYIVATRDEGEHFTYAGFKEWVTREYIRDCFIHSDSNGLEKALHKIYFKPKDMILIPQGMVHAMGGGATFMEFHTPCDYTFRLEKHFDGNTISDDELHYGLGIDALLDGIDYTTYSEKEISEKILYTPKKLERNNGSLLYELLSTTDTNDFGVQKLILDGSFTLQRAPYHYIFVVAKGDVSVTSNNHTTTVRQGRAAFVPAHCASSITFVGEESEILIGLPFEVSL